MEKDPPRVSSTGMCGDLRLSTTVIKRLDLAKADSHTGGMMLSFSNRARSRMACLAVVITALLCAAYPPKAVGTTQEDRWQWPTGAPVPVVRRVLPAGSRLVARAAGSHVALSSSIRGLRLCTGDGHRRWSSRRPWGHFDSPQRTWPRCLVDVPTCHSHRHCRRSRREGGRYRRR